MATAPIFTATPLVAHARLAAANTARDGSGTLSTLYTAPSGGARIDRVVWTSAQATAAASSAMVGRVFVTDAAGSNPRLRAEIAIPTVTASDTAAGAAASVSFPGGLFLASGQELQVAQSIYAGAQDQMDVIAEGGEF